MKFQLKALVAALALVAAVPASAALQSATTTGNGSFVLSVLDRTAAISATFDLGKLYSDFNVKGVDFADSGVTAEGTNFSWDLTTGNYATAWANFLSVATLPNVTYSVIAGDNLGNEPFTQGFIATYAGPSGSNYTSQQATATALGGNNFRNYIANQSNNTLVTYQNHSTVADGSSVSVGGTTYAGSAVFNGNRLNGTGPVIFGAIGRDLGVIQVNSAEFGSDPANQFIFGNGAKFNLSANGLLTYSTTAVAAVPEADTWAMMLLGLGFMGFVARRKQA